jgi:hypothetical protein
MGKISNRSDFATEGNEGNEGLNDFVFDWVADGRDRAGGRLYLIWAFCASSHFSWLSALRLFQASS